MGQLRQIEVYKKKTFPFFLVWKLNFAYFVLQNRFYLELVLFFIFSMLCFTSILLNRSYYDYLVDKDETLLIESESHFHSNNNTYCITNTDTASVLSDACQCAYLHPNDSSRYVIIKDLCCFYSGNWRENPQQQNLTEILHNWWKLLLRKKAISSLNLENSFSFYNVL